MFKIMWIASIITSILCIHIEFYMAFRRWGYKRMSLKEFIIIEFCIILMSIIPVFNISSTIFLWAMFRLEDIEV